MSVLLIRRRRPIGEPVTAVPISPDGVTSPDGAASPGGATILDGTAGAGRTVLALGELGVPLDAVIQLVMDSESPANELDALDLESRFEVVVLGSHLMNLPETSARRVFLGMAIRHLALGGDLLVEHHPADWAETAEATGATSGGSLGMVDVRRHPPFVSAVSTYDIGGRIVRQPFTARVWSEAELAAELEAGGLVIRRRLGPSWLVAFRAEAALR